MSGIEGVLGEKYVADLELHFLKFFCLIFNLRIAVRKLYLELWTRLCDYLKWVLMSMKFHWLLKN